MNNKELEAFAKHAAKSIKSEKDLTEFTHMLTKVAVEAALNAELDDHLGYERHEKANLDNSRNGFSSKTVRTDEGQFELDTPRDRNGTFEPQLVRKHQSRFTAMDDKILYRSAKGDCPQPRGRADGNDEICDLSHEPQPKKHQFFLHHHWLGHVQPASSLYAYWRQRGVVRWKSSLSRTRCVVADGSRYRRQFLWCQSFLCAGYETIGHQTKGKVRSEPAQ